MTRLRTGDRLIQTMKSPAPDAPDRRRTLLHLKHDRGFSDFFIARKARRPPIRAGPEPGVGCCTRCCPSSRKEAKA